MSEFFTVVLPDIGEGVVEGEIIEWLKDEGDALAQDEPVVMVMTDKATVELPAPYPGTLAKKHFQVGEISIKDKPLYKIELAEGVELHRTDKRREPREEEAVVPLSSKALSSVQVSSGGKAVAAPPVRKMARQLGIDLATIKGSGPSGMVLREDLASFTAKSATTPVTRFEDDKIEPLQGLRTIIAERMAESRRLIPDFSYFSTMDASRLVRMRKKNKAEAAEEGIKLTFMPFFIRSLAMAIAEYPQFNSSLDTVAKEIVIHRQVNIGIAVKTPIGLIVPVLKGVQDMSFHDVIRGYDDLIKRALTHRLDPKEMKDATITISNFGTIGGVWATPIINYPEVCILGVGRIEPRAVVRHGELAVREMLNLSWSCDHRVVDGDQCASFSNHFANLLENPVKIL
jgi:pyruvate dehydrogenase E2 component (dihydrolipoamide acetyltransferase)